MYQFFTEISNWLSQPFSNAAYSTNIAFLTVLFLGFVGSLAPCQISANLGAVAYFSNRYMQMKLSKFELTLFLLGKVIVFSLFGFLFWMFGNTVSTGSIPMFVFARKLIGPLFILMGLILLKLIRFPKAFYSWSLPFHKTLQRVDGKKKALLMGIVFSLGFCPTMFTLFFGGVMSISLQSPYGFILPSVFAVGTAMPLLFVIAVSVGLGVDRTILKQTRKWGAWVERFAGVLFVLLGVSDTITYWSM
jgi:cytochrome c-type biogenesis protein